MNVKTAYDKVKFVDITKETKQNLKEDKYPYQCYQCWYGKTNIGLIVWSDANAQYCYYPTPNMSLSLPANVIWDIFDKICGLMALRRLN